MIEGMGERRLFRRDEHGRFHPQLLEGERQLLADLPDQAMGMLAGDEPAGARLYPVAYPDDAETQAEYASVMSQSLEARHRGVLQVLADTAAAESIDEDQLQQWMGALEVLRLILGTDLDVSEEMEEIDALDPRAGRFALYTYLTLIQGEIIEALSAVLPTHVGEEE